MPYFKNNDINILFIHIPKTGGTSVERYFSSKFNIPLNNKSLFGEFYQFKVDSQLQHITFSDIVKYNKIFNINFDNIKIITVVRNPYERFVSDLFYFSLITINSTKEEVLNILNKYLHSNKYDNHNIPQHKFITNDELEIIKPIHILKRENLTNEMKNLGYIDFAVYNNQNIHKVNYYDYLNNESIEIINKFYDLDFKLFNYDKIL